MRHPPAARYLRVGLTRGSRIPLLCLQFIRHRLMWLTIKALGFALGEGFDTTEADIRQCTCGVSLT